MNTKNCNDLSTGQYLKEFKKIFMLKFLIYNIFFLNKNGVF
jgi:hypothetical protein